MCPLSSPLRGCLVALALLANVGSATARPAAVTAAVTGDVTDENANASAMAIEPADKTSDAPDNLSAAYPRRQPAPTAVTAAVAVAGGTGADGASAFKPAFKPAIEPVTEPDVTLVLRPGGARLSTALAEFTRDHGWELAWEIDRDFPIDHAARFDGPFLDIVAAVVGALRKTDAPVRAKIYHANKVVRIVHATR